MKRRTKPCSETTGPCIRIFLNVQESLNFLSVPPQNMPSSGAHLPFWSSFAVDAAVVAVAFMSYSFSINLADRLVNRAKILYMKHKRKC